MGWVGLTFLRPRSFVVPTKRNLWLESSREKDAELRFFVIPFLATRMAWCNCWRIPPPE